MVKRKQFIWLRSCFILIVQSFILFVLFLAACSVCETWGQESSPPPAAATLPTDQETIQPAPTPDRSGGVPPVLGNGGGSQPGIPPLSGSRPGALPFSGADPYATPNAYGWQNPQGPYNNQYNGYQSMPIYGGPQPGVPPAGNPWDARKLIERWRVDVLWMKGGSSSKKLGLTQLDLNLTFNWVGCLSPENALQITPGFTFNWWKMNDQSPLPFPERTYDAYVDLDWDPRLAQDGAISADLGLTMGVFSDFKKVDGHSFRLMGHAYGVFAVSSKLDLKLGAEYLNRVNSKILPAGGIVWRSGDDSWVVEAVFPSPKVKKKCNLIDSRSALWFYARGEYAGDTWTIKSQMPGMRDDVVSYNDIRIAVGVEFEFIQNVKGYIEMGGAFDRKLEYKRLGAVSAADSFFLQGGLQF